MIIAVNFPILAIGKKKLEKIWALTGIELELDESNSMLYQLSYEATHFIYTSLHFPPDRRYELNKLTSLPMCGFIAQLVEQRTGIAEVTGSNPVETLIFSGLLFSTCLNWKIYFDDHSSFLPATAVQK